MFTKINVNFFCIFLHFFNAWFYATRSIISLRYISAPYRHIHLHLCISKKGSKKSIQSFDGYFSDWRKKLSFNHWQGFYDFFCCFLNISLGIKDFEFKSPCYNTQNWKFQYFRQIYRFTGVFWPSGNFLGLRTPGACIYRKRLKDGVNEK